MPFLHFWLQASRAKLLTNLLARGQELREQPHSHDVTRVDDDLVREILCQEQDSGMDLSGLTASSELHFLTCSLENGLTQRIDFVFRTLVWFGYNFFDIAFAKIKDSGDALFITTLNCSQFISAPYDGTAGMFWSLFFAGVAALPSNATIIIQNFWEICVLIHLVLRSIYLFL